MNNNNNETHWPSKMPKSMAALGLTQRTKPHVVCARVALRFFMEIMKLPATVLLASMVVCRTGRHVGEQSHGYSTAVQTISWYSTAVQ